MVEVPVVDVAGKALGKEKIDPAWFGGIVRRKLLHEAVVIYEGNKRSGTANAKERGDVAGSGKKPWKQKHTGRARAGTKRSPIWVKGGVVFPPHPRDFSRSLPKQMKRLAVDSALLSKFQDGEALVLEGLSLDKPSTSTMASVLEKIGIKESCLLSTGANNAQGHNIWLSARNLPRVHALTVADLNTWDVLRYKRLVLTREAFTALVSSRRDKKPLGGNQPKAAPKKVWTSTSKKARGAAKKAAKHAAKPVAVKKKETTK